MTTYRMVLAYDGANYAGWQAQAPGPKTLQGTLEQALRTILGQPAPVVASGRTDAGVHALGQVVSFTCDTRLPPDTLLRAINANLPSDMAALSLEPAPQGFHARRDALRKRYRYVLYDGPTRELFRRAYCWRVKTRLDADAMQRAALPLIGRHDFSSFETAGSPRESSVRTVFDLAVRRGGDDNLSGGSNFVTVEIAADGFLYNMVRAVVGTLVEVGRGAQAESWPAEVLAACDRKQAGPNAPPHGLFLVEVQYET